jgi:hypothetical protein
MERDGGRGMEKCKTLMVICRMKEQSSSSQKIALDVPSSWEYTVKKEERKLRRGWVQFFLI